MRLGDVAHVRTGDKGDVAQIAVFCHDPADYDRLVRGLTTERVAAHFAALPIRAARRHELPHLAALNFVLEGALSGGVTRSLSLDAHGKTLGAQLLDLVLDDAAMEAAG